MNTAWCQERGVGAEVVAFVCNLNSTLHILIFGGRSKDQKTHLAF